MRNATINSKINIKSIEKLDFQHREEMVFIINRFRCVFLLSILILSVTGTSHATVFQPVIDEFWIVKNGTEIFRDSFDDGMAPPSGPDGAMTYNMNAGDGGLVGGEGGGSLTMTPSLGNPSAITGVTADTFTGAIRRASINATSSNFLGVDDAFSIFAQYDLTTVPGVPGQAFGIRATDRASGNRGNNVAQLDVARDRTTDEVGVRLLQVDFVGDTVERADFVSLQSLLGTAAKIQLILSKDAGSDAIEASFIAYGELMNVLAMGDLDTILNQSLAPILLYQGEDYIRAQFFSVDTDVAISPVPLPGALPLLLAAIMALGLVSRSRRHVG